MSDPETVARRLDASYQPWVDGLSDEQASAVLDWQGVDRQYESIQKVVRTGEGDDTERATVKNLISAVFDGRTPEDLYVWRGVRSSMRTFGLNADRLDTFESDENLILPGFAATTLSKSVAIEQFTNPPLAGGPVLLRIRVPAGTPAAWVAIAGDPELSDQYEILFGPALRLQLGSVDYADESGIPVLNLEVI